MSYFFSFDMLSDRPFRFDKAMPVRALICGGVLSLSACGPGFTEPMQKSPNSIIGKTTQDIGEFKPEEKKEVSDQNLNVTNPVTGPLEAYRPMVERVVIAQIDQALRLYEAENGKYPATYEEFMEQIIKKNGIRLPVLPGGWKYEYNVAEHKLEVVQDKPAAP